MQVKSFLRENNKTIRIIKIVIASLLGLMVIIDIVLVFLEDKGFPTFSKVIEENRTELIWLNFLLGGLIAKVFYNRIVHTKQRELSGFLAFFAMIVLLFVLGRVFTIELDTPYHLLIMICGGILAHRAWPQYIHDESTE
ncbi:hypothetical protein [Allomuricauda sp. SCSIO 65647]|uniref:hypothetical protein n=1 Tax=Allomuricauda sp. SCSIO 65647 TaxID=2908843 RepID=UPI001F464C17|nr:hypothetical protein [Muricauda sp. SCSIO 65647]UJH67609.1 hypothetical protein L0P89_16890 [Muricauda sp. SCSIO 65647]